MALDIADDGLILGQWYDYGTDAENGGYLWEGPNGGGRRLLGSTGEWSTEPHTISGNMVIGDDTYDPDGTKGARWDLDSGEITTYERGLSTVNSDGDVTFVSSWPARITRVDGTTVKLASLDRIRPRDVHVLFDRGSDLVAAGWARNERKLRKPVVWRDC